MSVTVNLGDILAGKYRVERFLGAGGMGVVVLARHLALGEPVAIKLLRSEVLGAEGVMGRFLREGRAAARLRSEHVARLFDVGELESGVPYLVMEYLDGLDLGSLLRKGERLPLPRAVDHVLETSEALAEAHSLGIIHRDIKPANVFLVKRVDGTSVAKLIDFGISKLASTPDDTPGGDLTKSAMILGSPSYMSPEQILSARDVDGRADIFALGVLLHTLLVGTPPFHAPSVVEVYERIGKGAPPLRSLRPDTPEGLEAAVLTCLQKDRSLRYSTVGELAAALAPFGTSATALYPERIQRVLASRRPDSPSSVAPRLSFGLNAAEILGSEGPSHTASAVSVNGRAEQRDPRAAAEDTKAPVSPSVRPFVTVAIGSSLRTIPPTRPHRRPIAAIAVGVALAAAALTLGSRIAHLAAPHPQAAAALDGHVAIPAYELVKAAPSPTPSEARSASPLGSGAPKGADVSTPSVTPSAPPAESANADHAARPSPVPQSPVAHPAPKPASAAEEPRAVSPRPPSAPAPSPSVAKAPTRSADDLFGTQK